MKNKINTELENLLLLLELEREEDLFQYQQRMKDESLSEMREQGVCWYPVQLEQTKYAVGERLLITISRHKEHAKSHLFQSGKIVSIFSNKQNNRETLSINGVVNFVKESEMVITINSNNFPDWLSDKNLGIQLLFDENTYKEMETAVKYLLKTENEQINNLKSILLGNSEAQFLKRESVYIPFLNENQNKALNRIRNARDVAIIHGPPGTGKTTTLVHSIIHTLKDEKQILVCAPSNTAIDLLTEKLLKKDINIVRIGHPARVTDELLTNTLDARITQHINYKDLKKIRKQASENYRLAKKHKRKYGYEERQQKKALYSEAKMLSEEAKHLKFYIINDILSSASVIACTLVGASNKNITTLRFNTVFIDEATQAIEPATWIPILKSDRVIFAGDHCQLPPTIKSYKAAKNGLETTLFEKAIKRNNADIMLNEQYRMNNKIMNFSNQYFYDNKLFANETVRDWKIFDNDLPIEFIDTAGCGYTEQVDSKTKSTFNKEEVELLFLHFDTYLIKLKELGIINTIKDIGIISPYKAQVNLLRNDISEYIAFTDILEKTRVNTVDSFQGQERDIIYISLVRSNEQGKIGFLSDVRRMNVAMTRARKKLVIIGDSATICRHKFYNNFFDYVNRIGAYKSAFEYI